MRLADPWGTRLHAGQLLDAKVSNYRSGQQQAFWEESF